MKSTFDLEMKEKTTQDDYFFVTANTAFDAPIHEAERVPLLNIEGQYDTVNNL